MKKLLSPAIFILFCNYFVLHPSFSVQEQTSQTQEQIERLQNGVKHVVRIMETGRTQTQSTVALATQAGAAFETITQSVITITDLNTKIAESAETHNRHAGGISTTLAGIGHIAEDATHAAQQASNMGKEFTFLARQLKDLVNQILLGKQNRKQSTAQDVAGCENNNDITLF